MEIIDVHKSFGNLHVLRGINLNVEKGEVISIIGSSGSDNADHFGVLKDSALVSVIGYVELLRASQILTTRTQQPFLILAVVGAFYFALSFPIARIMERLEHEWQDDGDH